MFSINIRGLFNILELSTCNLTSGVPGLASNWVRLAPNGTNLGLFQIKFQYNLALKDKNLKIKFRVL